VTADEYLRDILAREAVDTAADSPLRALERDVSGVCREVVGDALVGVYPTGAFEKGTANASGLAADFLVSLAPGRGTSIGDADEAIHEAFDRRGFELIRRDVSIAALIDDIGVDIVPGRRESMTSDVHEIWLSRPGRRIKTNPAQHVVDAANAGRIEETRVLKLWREQRELDFPSFYLELTVRAALRKAAPGDREANVWAVVGYLEKLFAARSVVDPANANNIVSDLLRPPERDAIRKAAAFARAARAWVDIIS